MTPPLASAQDQGIPLPPPRLRQKVAGRDNAEWFVKSGELSLADLSRALAAIGRSIDDFNDVLDWGCGCGRMLRHLLPPRPPRRIHGFDVDREAIAWINENLPWVQTSCNDGMPPLPYADATFDLIFNHSVMTHLDAAYQDAWLAELRRLLRPGGIATLTVHGRNAFNVNFAAAPPQTRDASAAQLRADGILFIDNVQPKGDFPAFYQVSYNDVPYVFDHWGRFLDVRCYIPRGALDFQDLVVLQRPTLGDGRPGSQQSWSYESWCRDNDAAASVGFGSAPWRTLGRGWRWIRNRLGRQRAAK